jgi:hypothetical protein
MLHMNTKFIHFLEFPYRELVVSSIVVVRFFKRIIIGHHRTSHFMFLVVFFHQDSSFIIRTNMSFSQPLSSIYFL